MNDKKIGLKIAKEILRKELKKLESTNEKDESMPIMLVGDTVDFDSELKDIVLDYCRYVPLEGFGVSMRCVEIFPEWIFLGLSGGNHDEHDIELESSTYKGYATYLYRDSNLINKIIVDEDTCENRVIMSFVDINGDNLLMRQINEHACSKLSKLCIDNYKSVSAIESDVTLNWDLSVKLLAIFSEFLSDNNLDWMATSVVHDNANDLSISPKSIQFGSEIIPIMEDSRGFLYLENTTNEHMYQMEIFPENYRIYTRLVSLPQILTEIYEAHDWGYVDDDRQNQKLSTPILETDIKLEGDIVTLSSDYNVKKSSFNKMETSFRCKVDYVSSVLNYKNMAELRRYDGITEYADVEDCE